MIITVHFDPLLAVLWHKSYRIKQITQILVCNEYQRNDALPLEPLANSDIPLVVIIDLLLLENMVEKPMIHKWKAFFENFAIFAIFFFFLKKFVKSQHSLKKLTVMIISWFYLTLFNSSGSFGHSKICFQHCFWYYKLNILPPDKLIFFTPCGK